MAKVICICGKICCGKTTYAQSLLKKEHAVLLSTDEITLALFDQHIGEKHDEIVERTQDYLLHKSVEITACGISVVLDWGFWQKEERDAAKAFFAQRDIPYEFHYLDIDDALWQQRRAKRNAAILAQEVSAYYVDEGLAKKFGGLFEKPEREEIDIWLTPEGEREMDNSENKKTIIDISDIYLDTPRLLLRPWWENDLQDFYAYASVPGVGEMAGWPHHTAIEDTKRVLSMFMREKNVWAIVLKEENRVIGSLGLHSSWANEEKHYPRDRILEIGYVLSKEYWGKGLMPEAVKRVLRFCFDQLSLDAVTVCHFTENIQSRRVIEKCGFSFCQKDQFENKYDSTSREEMQYILWREDMK